MAFWHISSILRISIEPNPADQHIYHLGQNESKEPGHFALVSIYWLRWGGGGVGVGFFRHMTNEGVCEQGVKPQGC